MKLQKIRGLMLPVVKKKTRQVKLQTIYGN